MLSRYIIHGSEKMHNNGLTIGIISGSYIVKNKSLNKYGQVNISTNQVMNDFYIC
jgi:hypothetical protein